MARTVIGGLDSCDIEAFLVSSLHSRFNSGELLAVQLPSAIIYSLAYPRLMTRNRKLSGLSCGSPSCCYRIQHGSTEMFLQCSFSMGVCNRRIRLNFKRKDWFLVGLRNQPLSLDWGEIRLGQGPQMRLR